MDRLSLALVAGTLALTGCGSPPGTRPHDMSAAGHIAQAEREEAKAVRHDAHEMARVTKPGGAIVIVDYALPRNAFARAMVYHLVKLYEPEYYARFVQTDLRVLLEGAGIEVRDQRPALLGVATILTGRTLEVTDRVRETDLA